MTYTPCELLIFAAIWIACGVIAAGYEFADRVTSTKYERVSQFKSDQGRALTSICFGLLSLMYVTLAQDMFRTSIDRPWLWPWGDRARKRAGL